MGASWEFHNLVERGVSIFKLAAGTYKLLARERMEQDAAIFGVQDQMYGFPPVFFPNGRDFAAAAPIRLAAGATFQADLKLARREYYPVKIAVANTSPVLCVSGSFPGRPSGAWLRVELRSR